MPGSEASAAGASTGFLDAARASPERLRDEIARATASPVVSALLASSAAAAAVVDRSRQVVAANDAYLRLLGLDDAGGALGLRVGEAAGCAHAEEGAGGCGTSAACASCGTAIALLVAGHRGRAEERECALRVVRGDEAVDRDFRVRAAPLDLEGEPFVLLTLRDVSAERRRDALERTFLHDVANLAVGLRSAADALADPAPAEDAAAEVRALSERLVHEIRLQRALLADRLPAWAAAPEPVPVGGALELVRAAAARDPAAAGKRLDVAPAPRGAVVTADPTLLHHVLARLVSNALEATARGGEVRVSASAEDGEIAFRVWNAGAIPAAVRPRIFQRYFTTKPGAGRGQGTWAAKTLAEEHLGGAVGFTTSAGAGTVFELRLPLHRGRA